MLPFGLLGQCCRAYTCLIPSSEFSVGKSYLYFLPNIDIYFLIQVPSPPKSGCKALAQPVGKSKVWGATSPQPFSCPSEGSLMAYAATSWPQCVKTALWVFFRILLFSSTSLQRCHPLPGLCDRLYAADSQIYM